MVYVGLFVEKDGLIEKINLSFIKNSKLLIKKYLVF
jgi:hypothetical protein